MILDTNVFAELVRPQPDPRVVAFCEARRGAFRLSAVVRFEVENGLRAMPPGRRRAALEGSVDDLYRLLVAWPTLPFGNDEASACAALLSERGRAGRPLDANLPDAMIAATARVAGLPLATRNTADFEGLGLALVDPWAAR